MRPSALILAAIAAGHLLSVIGAPCFAEPLSTPGNYEYDLLQIPHLGVSTRVAFHPDGSYADYSALGLSTSTENIANPVPAPATNTARRAPAVVVGKATPTTSFLYVIGGDDGATRYLQFASGH